MIGSFTQSADFASTQTPASWTPLLQNAVRASFVSAKSKTDGRPLVAHCACIRPDGRPTLQAVDFLESCSLDPGLLFFTANTKNSDLLGALKQPNDVEMQLSFDQECFVLTGRVHIIVAPTLSHRFGGSPKKFHFKDSAPIQGVVDTDLFWEGQRLSAFRQLSDAYRGSFTWPSPGEVTNTLGSHSNDFGYQYLSLNYVDPDLAHCVGNYSLSPLAASSYLAGSSSSWTPSFLSSKSDASPQLQEELTAVNTAYDNFCLLVFQAKRVDWARRSSNIAKGPGTRMVWDLSKGSWQISERNPNFF